MLRIMNGKLAIVEGVAFTIPDGFWIKETWEERITLLSPDMKSRIEFGICNTTTLLEDA